MLSQAHELLVYSSHLPCPSCGTATPHREPYRKWGFPIRACAGCGLGRTITPAGFSAASIYDRGYFQGGRADGYADYAASAPVLRQEFRRVISRLREKKATGALLEVGCAYGYFLEEASPFYDCLGVEVSADAAASCQEKGLDVRRSIDELGDHPRFDAIVMLDVIEHLASPMETVARLREMMEPGGLLVLSTGDWGSPVARLMGKSWRLMTPPQHLWYFTQRSMRQLLARAGFEIQALEHPWKFVPLDLVFYQLTRRLGWSTARPAWLARVGLPLNLFDAMAITAVAK